MCTNLCCRSLELGTHKFPESRNLGLECVHFNTWNRESCMKVGRKRDNWNHKRSSTMYVIVSCLVLFAATAGLTSYYSSDNANCRVSGTNSQLIDGYFVAENGAYWKTGSQLVSVPDSFSFFRARYYDQPTSSSVVIIFRSGVWSIADLRSNTLFYGNTCRDSVGGELETTCVRRPPSTGWNHRQHIRGIPTVSERHGSLDESFTTSSGRESNLAKLWETPVTTILLTAVVAVAYLLWAYSVEVSAISYSYDKVIVQGEYWRMVTASFSHVDLWHLLFNTMTLYTLSNVETLFGSLSYAYLSAALVFLTMLLCAAIDAILIHRFHQADQQFQQGIGYSCVLFAWLVALCVHLPTFCPLFFLPSLCLDTYIIPVPGTSGLPVNLAPFILLGVTKLLIPRSSFYGHLSGIIVGYPLAWHFLDFLTPPVTCLFLVGLWSVQQRGWLLKVLLSHVVNSNDRRSWTAIWSFLPATTSQVFLAFCVCSVLVALYAVVVLFWVWGLDQLWIRLWTMAIVCAVPVVHKYFFYAEDSNNSTGESTEEYRRSTSMGVQFLCLTLLAMLIIWMCDVYTLIVTVSAAPFLTGNGITSGGLLVAQSLLSIGVVLQFAYLLLGLWMLQSVAAADNSLQMCRLDRRSVLAAWALIYDRCCKSATVAFSGRSFALRASDSAASQETMNPMTASATAPPAALEMTMTATASAPPAAVGPEGQAMGSGRGYDALPQSSDDDEELARRCAATSNPST